MIPLGIIAAAPQATPPGGSFTWSDDFTIGRMEYTTASYLSLGGGKLTLNSTEGGGLIHPGPVSWVELNVRIEGDTTIYRHWELRALGYIARFSNSNGTDMQGLWRNGVRVDGSTVPAINIAATWLARMRVEAGQVQAAVWPADTAFPGWQIDYTDPAPLTGDASFGLSGYGSSTIRRPVFLAPFTATGG